MFRGCASCVIQPNPNKTFDEDTEWEYILEEISVTDYTASETANQKTELSATGVTGKPVVELDTQPDASTKPPIRRRSSFFMNIFANTAAEETPLKAQHTEIVGGGEIPHLPNPKENEDGGSISAAEEEVPEDKLNRKRSMFSKSKSPRKEPSSQFDPDFGKKVLRRNSLTKMYRDVHHAGTFNTLIFKGVAYKKPQRLLDLEKNPPKLDFTGQPFKVNMDKENLIDGTKLGITDLGKKASCCIYKVSFLKSHWLAICLDPDSLNGSVEKEIIHSGRWDRLIRELKCQNPTDVFNAIFCVHACTLRSYKSSDGVAIIQHLLNKRLYACAALVHDLPEGRTTEKVHQYDVEMSAPWFDMERDVLELAMRVRSRFEESLPSWISIANSAAMRKKGQLTTTQTKARPVTSPRGKKAPAGGKTVAGDGGGDIAPWAKSAAAPIAQKSKAKAEKPEKNPEKNLEKKSEKSEKSEKKKSKEKS